MRRASPNAMVQNEDEHRPPPNRIPKEKHAACHPNQRGEDEYRAPLPPPRPIVG